MNSDNSIGTTLENYIGYEAVLLYDLMNCCGRYINYLGIV